MKFKKLFSAIITMSMVISTIAIPAKAEKTVPVESNGNVRAMEKLDRGLVVMSVDDGNYLSWRFFGNENRRTTTFRVYCDGTYIANVDDSTNYIHVGGKASSKYKVVAVVNGQVNEEDSSKEVSRFSSGSNYFDIELNVPADFTAPDGIKHSYAVGDTSCGDLDGDGEYELIIKWDCNAQDNSNAGYTGNVLLDAYKLDGTMLWRVDLGVNIRGGAHYTQFMVYDLDGDGKAEMGLKTAPGSKDGLGKYVSEASLVDKVKSADNTKDYRNGGGYILSGPEYYTVFSGDTGAAIDTIEYPTLRGTDKDNNVNKIWGDTYGNRVDRHLATIAYLDGENPSIIEWRGYYGGQSGSGAGRTAISAITLVDGRLQVGATFDTWSQANKGYTKGNEQYIAQGNHNLTVADVDGDGRDEVLSGALCFEDDLTVKWCSFRGHGDALHIGNYDPTHEGYEYFSVHESGAIDGSWVINGKEIDYGMTVYDAATGDELLHSRATETDSKGKYDTGRGAMANVGAGGYYQLWATNGTGTYKAMGNNKFEKISINGASSNFRVFWDGDLYDELLDGTAITSWNGSKMQNIFNARGCTKVNGTKSTPALQADILGDWREEVIYPLSDNTAVRVYTTNIYTEYKLPTLMHDSVYRAGVAAENTAYNQPPHIGYYLSEDLFAASVVSLEITPPTKTKYKVGEDIDLAGMKVTGCLDDNTKINIFDYNISGLNSYSVGTQTMIISYKEMTAKFDVEVVTDVVLDENTGTITGYNGNDDNIILPTSINGVEVVAIGENAFKNSSIKTITILDNIESIAEDVFDTTKGITIMCYEGSIAHIYAMDNNITYIILGINATFDEDEFKEFSLVMAKTAKSTVINGLEYGVGGRILGGDQNTGFSILSENNNSVLKVGVGQYASFNRNAYMSIVDVPTLSEGSGFVLNMNYYIPRTGSDDDSTALVPKIEISDEVAVVDTICVEEDKGIEYDTWYNYKLIYNEGEYYKVISDLDGYIIYMKNIDVSGSEFLVSKLSFVQAAGDFVKGSVTYIYLDNFKIHSSQSPINDVQFNVIGSSGEKVEGAKISVGMVEAVTDINGVAVLKLPIGTHKANVYISESEQVEVIVTVKNTSVIKNVMVGLRNIEEFNVDNQNNIYSVAANISKGSVGQNVVVICAQYDKDGELINVSLEPMYLEESSCVIRHSFEVSDEQAAKIDKTKLIILNGFNDMMPVTGVGEL